MFDRERKTLLVQQIKPQETYEWFLQKHYAKRIPPITYAFGLFDNNNLIGVITYGSPPSRSLCVGLCGEKHSDVVLELNRLCLQNNDNNQASFIISHSLKLLPKPKIVVSYADTSMGHVGYVYQATNFIYTGLSAKRTEWREKNSNKHSKTISQKVSLDERKINTEKYEIVDRPQKHRYVYFCGSKTQKKSFMRDLNYDILPYPKGDNKRYDSGDAVNTQMVMF